MTALARLGEAVSRLVGGRDRLELTVGPEGPRGDLLVPRAGDGVWDVVSVQGRSCLTPDESSHYIYFVLPAAVLARAQNGLWLEVEYFGASYGRFRVQYASSDASAMGEGVYKSAEQRWDGEAVGLRRFRRALFALPDFDPARTQTHCASFRVEFREEVLISRLAVGLHPPADAAAFTQTAPLPHLKKLPGRFYPINYLFIEITNACNFKCTWCPDDIMGRRRGFMKKERVFRILEEIAAKRSWLGPIYPVKLHQMGEPFLHPDLVEIVERAERSGVPIELNTNCGLITRERIEGLYGAGLTNLILSYQTPDTETFKTRKAPRLVFDEYRDKVRLAVERKVALGARTNLEVDIMNTKYAEGYRIVSEDEQALAFLADWIEFAQGLERQYAVPPRTHDWDRIRARNFLDQDENGSRYPLLEGVNLIWKRCHSWGNVIPAGNIDPAARPAGSTGGERRAIDSRIASGGSAGRDYSAPWLNDDGSAGGPAEHPPAQNDTYCPAPYDQFVIQWNGDVVACCTDYEGRTKTANVFASSIEEVWKGDVLKQRKKDMLEGQLLDVCAKCQGVR